jgi:hypothetical protein
MKAGRIPPVLRRAVMALAFLLANSSLAFAQQSNLETAVKATFVLRFASFVQWPAASFADPAAPIVICVTGDPELGGLVESAARGERVGAHPIMVRRLDVVAINSGCHILYASSARNQSVARALETIRGQPVLTVTDERDGNARGMIHFVRDNGRVRFRIDRDASDAAGLDLNARLLSVALSVRSRRTT